MDSTQSRTATERCTRCPSTINTTGPSVSLSNRSQKSMNFGAFMVLSMMEKLSCPRGVIAEIMIMLNRDPSPR